MRQFAMAVATVLVLAMISPAFAQPFADTPPNHWAYDAIAELAAKGLIEGYPDGTFKGDRAMTRYEMAMVVARLLARIESIQIPAPGPGQPQVSKQDIDNIMRLVNEFRAELAAKNVRLTAVEEELNAIKARLDNVRITGAVRFRYNWQGLGPASVGGGGTGPSLNGNPNTSSTPVKGQTPQIQEAFKLLFDGSVMPDLHFIGAVTTNGANNNWAFNSGSYGPGSQATFSAVDIAFLDWKNVGGIPLEFWIGRFGGQGPGATYPVQFGPFGLLMNTGGDTWEDTTANSGTNSVDGIYANYRNSQLLDLQIQAIYTRADGLNGFNTFISGQNIWGVDVNVKVIEGLRLGGNYVADSINQSGGTFGNAALGPNYNLYGPGGGAANPSTANCISQGPLGFATSFLSTFGGIQCPAAGNGFGFYADWTIIPGIKLDGEWAQWNDTVNVVNAPGWNAVISWDLGTLLGVGHGFVITTGYQSYSANFYPPAGAAELDIFGFDALYPGNGNGFTATLSFNITDAFNIYVDWLTGNSQSNGMSFSEWEAGLHYKLAPNTGLLFYYRDLTMGGVDQANRYRAELTYSF